MNTKNGIVVLVENMFELFSHFPLIAIKEIQKRDIGKKMPYK